MVCRVPQQAVHSPFVRVSMGRLPLIFVLLVAGCGERSDEAEVHPARGKLIINSEPAFEALLSLHPVQDANFDQRGSRPWAVTKEDGTFELSTYGTGDGAPVGEYYVAIVWMDDPLSPAPGPDKLGGRFAKPESTGIRVTISEGDNQLEAIELENVQVVKGRKRPMNDDGPPGF